MTAMKSQMGKLGNKP